MLVYFKNRLAFSPDNKHMYLSYQSDGIIYDVTRMDGYPFGAHRLDIKYHASWLIEWLLTWWDSFICIIILNAKDIHVSITVIVAFISKF